MTAWRAYLWLFCFAWSSVQSTFYMLKVWKWTIHVMVLPTVGKKNYNVEQGQKLVFKDYTKIEYKKFGPSHYVSRGLHHCTGVSALASQWEEPIFSTDFNLSLWTVDSWVFSRRSSLFPESKNIFHRLKRVSKLPLDVCACVVLQPKWRPVQGA